ncbi:hypothetical protein AAVH_00197 [Aphelenchoides avenae]|nr:hypothetical protein AAVH_00197 [Aphelenchus avenae]
MGPLVMIFAASVLLPAVAALSVKSYTDFGTIVSELADPEQGTVFYRVDCGERLSEAAVGMPLTIMPVNETRDWCAVMIPTNVEIFYRPRFRNPGTYFRVLVWNDGNRPEIATKPAYRVMNQTKYDPVHVYCDNAVLWFRFCNRHDVLDFVMLPMRPEVQAARWDPQCTHGDSDDLPEKPRECYRAPKYVPFARHIPKE